MSQSELDNTVLNSGVTIMKGDNPVSKSDAVILGSNAGYAEDRFVGLYESTKTPDGATIIPPQHNPDTLTSVVHSNNTLMQCIEAMEVNIDGTGFEIEPSDPKMDASKVVGLDAVIGLMDEPYPTTTMTSLRRALRRDIEITGNGYLEVIRNAAGDIMLLKQIPSVTMRLCRLSPHQKVTKNMYRNGKSVRVSMQARLRPFAQIINRKPIYFKEYGASEHLDKHTGGWSSKVKPKDRATEIIHFTAVLDGTSPYGVPRWINQTPSAIGSRKAEENNLDFFNSGGLPPVLITVSGGIMVKETKQALENYLNGKNSKNRAAILEAYASGTSLDNSGSVKITVERFGSERVSDSMFENYDAKCSTRIRGAFRLPELYVGQNGGNFAASRAASMLAEAQVFKPERREFDATMNLTIIRELSQGTVKMTSKQNTIKDGNLQMKGIAVARSTGAVSPESIVDNISDVAGVSLTYSAEELSLSRQGDKQAALDAMAGTNTIKNPPAESNNSLDAGKGLDKKAPEKVIKFEEIAKQDIEGLAWHWGKVATGDSELSADDMIDLQDIVESLEDSDREEFSSYLASNVFPDCGDDKQGASELAQALAEIEVIS